jgi:3-deoxy-manno-octulosonate cytidylyltransferase (CMP-KDO synthetase)
VDNINNNFTGSIWMKTAILIPARYGSTRFPGKPLALLDGVPMIQRVYDACTASNLPTYVLTDHQEIYNMMGASRCIMDLADYENGTERCAGAVEMRTLDDYDQFINVQGDMPDITVDMIERCVKKLKDYPVSTVYTDMPEQEQNNPNSVKLVRGEDRALWFGRGMTGYGDWHLGVYGYRRFALDAYINLPVTQEETIEQLEQLRWLKNGWQIGCSNVQFDGVEINTPEDLKKWHE